MARQPHWAGHQGHIDWRGICDYGSPHEGLCLTVRRWLQQHLVRPEDIAPQGVLVADGPEVASLNKNCAVKSSKAARAGERPRSAALRARHTPAMHRGFEPYGEICAAE